MSISNAGAASSGRAKATKRRSSTGDALHVVKDETNSGGEVGGWSDLPATSRLAMPTLRLRMSVEPEESWPRSVDDLFEKGRLFVRDSAGAELGPVLRAFLGEGFGNRLESLRDELSKQDEPNLFLAVHSLASACFVRRALDDAAALMALLVGWKAGQFDGFLGLSSIALSRGQKMEALVFAQEAIRTGVKHSTAYCIAGLMELDRGDRKAGQPLLAASARLARADPRFRDDLRVAQRALLMMHLT